MTFIIEDAKYDCIKALSVSYFCNKLQLNSVQFKTF